jgi:hypothetical protein
MNTPNTRTAPTNGKRPAKIGGTWSNNKRLWGRMALPPPAPALNVPEPIDEVEAMTNESQKRLNTLKIQEEAEAPKERPPREGTPTSVSPEHLWSTLLSCLFQTLASPSLGYLPFGFSYLWRDPPLYLSFAKRPSSTHLQPAWF